MRIGGIMNVNSNHWVAVVIYLRLSTVLYGDSLRGSDGDVVAAFCWWAGLHTGRQFRQAALPIGVQTDTTSCGLFALNALFHHFFPDMDTINQRMVITERLWMFCAASHLEVDAVSWKISKF
jgi:hypothetical protein